MALLFQKGYRNNIFRDAHIRDVSCKFRELIIIIYKQNCESCSC